MLKLVNGLKHFKIFQCNIKKYSTIVKMPSLSPTMDSGGIVEWYKKEGDEVSAGDLLCEVQTDKAVVGMEAEEDGILAKIIKPKDSKNVTVGEPIAVMADRSEDWRVVGSKEVVGVSVTPSVVTTATTTDTVAKEIESLVGVSTQDKVGPAARLLLQSYGIKPAQVAHTGPHNTLLKSDVLGYIDQASLKPVAVKEIAAAPPPAIKSTSSYLDLPLTNMRQTIAKRLTASKMNIPHFYATGEAVIDNVLSARTSLKKAGVSVSVNDFVVAACALSLRLVPEVNSRLSKDGENIVFNDTVDISVAVASESGLITPIVFNADSLELSVIGSTIRNLADKARHNKLQPQEFIGGTFTISNLGMFGIKEFTAIINAPQCAILAVGAGIPSLVTDSANKDRPKVEVKMRFTLSADARIVDSSVAARFLSHVKSYLENPQLLMTKANEAQAWGY